MFTGTAKYQQTLKNPLPSGNAQLFPETIQKVVNIYVFSLAFPFLAIGVSVSFYIFLYLIYMVKARYHHVFKLRTWYDWLFILFPIVSLLSVVFGPPLPRAPGFMNDFQIWTQYCYWMILVLFLRTHGPRIDWLRVVKSAFLGTTLLILSFFLLRVTFSLGFLNIMFSIPRNAYVFQMLCLVPICLLYIRIRFNRFIFYSAVLGYLVLVFISEGRAGSIIVLIEIGLIVYLFNRSLQNSLRWLLIPLLLTGVIFFSDFSFSPEQVESVAAFVDDYNPRLAALIRGEDEGDLSQDKSWLIRELMIDKSKEVVADYPFLGVGLNRFKYYDASLPSLNEEHYKRLRYLSRGFYNSRSAHSSYYQLLAETGYIGITIVLLIIFVPIFKLLARLITRPSMKYAFCIGLLGISMHYYVISSITGAIGWFTLGLAYFFLDYDHRISLSHPHTNSARR